MPNVARGSLPYQGRLPANSRMEDLPTSFSTDGMFDFNTSEDFNLDDFFHLEPDETLWTLVGNSHHEANEPEFVARQPHEATTTENININSIEFGTQVLPSTARLQPAANGKSKSDPFTEAEWEVIFDVVFPLYLDPKNSLATILKLLPERAKLSPSKKQLKTRIQLWHEQNRLPYRNIDKNDMDYMVLVAHLRKRDGLQTVFMYHGFQVDDGKLRKHMKRWGIKYQEIKPESSPSYITWFTPSKSMHLTPEHGALPQSSLKVPQNDAIAFQSSSVEIGPNLSGGVPSHLSIIPRTDQNISPCLDGNQQKGEISHIGAKRRQVPSSLPSSEFGPRHILNARSTRKIEGLNRPINSASPSPSIQRKYLMPLEPENAKKASVEALAAETKSIYAGLVLVETKAINVMRAQVDNLTALGPQEVIRRVSPDMWKALIALHRCLLHEHTDFLHATQHPCASPALKRLASKYSMVARMWKHGCHGLLELLRRSLPHTLDYMLSFLQGVAYPIFTYLFETVPAFEKVWAECLGDLARYRMAIEDESIQDREIWAAKARSWYHWFSDRSPHTGRLYHHLGILSRPIFLRQLFYYCQSLTAPDIFTSARSLILTVLEPVVLHGPEQKTNLLEPFRKVHLAFLSRDVSEDHIRPSDFVHELKSYLAHLWTLEREECIQIAAINITALFDYGEQTPFRHIFAVADHFANQRISSKSEDIELPDTLAFSNDVLDTCSYTAKCELIFDTMEAILSHHDEWLAISHVLIVLAFLLSLAKASNPSVMPFSSDVQLIFQRFSWKALCAFLNRDSFEGWRASPPLSFPRPDDGQRRPLPEDYMTRGFIWTKEYFPADWFEEEHELEEKLFEYPVFNARRIRRAVWLALELRTFGFISFEGNVFSEVCLSEDVDTDICLSLDEWGQELVYSQHQASGSERVSYQAFDSTASRESWSASGGAEISSTSPSSFDGNFPEQTIDK